MQSFGRFHAALVGVIDWNPTFAQYFNNNYSMTAPDNMHKDSTTASDNIVAFVDIYLKNFATDYNTQIHCFNSKQKKIATIEVNLNTIDHTKQKIITQVQKIIPEQRLKLADTAFYKCYYCTSARNFFATKKKNSQRRKKP